MAILPINDRAGKYGIIRDISPYHLPAEAWSAGQNVRMKEGAVQKFLGHKQVYGTLSGAPHFVMPVRTPTTFYWIYASLTGVFVTDGTNHFDITKTATTYGATQDENWVGEVFGGVPILNNAVDAPQMWAPVSTGQLLQDLTAWPAGAVCKALRGFKTFLVALNYTNGSGTAFPRLVKWSHSASFNSVPSSWDETDDTLDAGEYEIADTNGKIIDGARLDDAFIIYKSDSVWGMQYIGPPLIFQFFAISKTIGALAKRCVKEFEGGHFVFGVDDCFITDGRELKSVLTDRMRRELFATISSDHYERSFVAHHKAFSEMWACYPTGAATVPDRALVWNYRDNTTFFRDLPNVGHIEYGVVDDTGQDVTWNAPGTWDADTTYWDETTFNPSVNRLLMAGTSDSELYVADETNQFDGSNMESYIERTGLVIDTLDKVKHCRALYPRMISTGPVEVRVGSQMSPDAAVSWSPVRTFNPDTDHKIDVRVSGRLLAVRFQSSSNVEWRLDGYSMDIIGAGRN